METDGSDGPLTGRTIDALHEDLLTLDPAGREGRSARRPRPLNLRRGDSAAQRPTAEVHRGGGSQKGPVLPMAVSVEKIAP